MAGARDLANLDIETSLACKTPARVHSVLATASAADLRLLPFPHLVIENCLPADYYHQLAHHYPDDELILGANAQRGKAPPQQNQRVDLSARDVEIHRDRIAPIWRDFVDYHTSPAFLAEVLSLFGPAIRSCYPQLEQAIGAPMRQWSSGLRFDPERDNGDISMDCQPGINTPVTRPSAVRRVHTDSPEELFAGLLYFRRPEDDSSGGDLEIHRWRRGSRRRFEGKEIAEKDAELIDTVSYRANTLVFFINTCDALHAVSERSVTPHTRRLVNLLGEVYRPLPKGLYEKPQNATYALRRYLRKRLRRLGPGN